MAAPETQAFVYSAHEDDFYRTGRTLRSLRAAGIQASEIAELKGRTLRKILAAERPVLFVRAGLWLASFQGYATPLPSAGGKPLCALGAVRPRTKGGGAIEALAARWTECLQQSGGDFSRLPDARSRLGPFFESPSMLFLDGKATAALREAGASSWAEIADIACERFRLVHCPPLDVYDGTALRVLQVITGLQRGGAERVTLDLVRELPGQGCAVQLATLGRAGRESFPAPEGAIDLSQAAADSDDRIAVLQQRALAFGADVIHAHLVTGAEAQSLAAADFPVMLTLHNTREGWPSGTCDLQRGQASLLIACSAAVEREARAAPLPIPLRTIRNGIDLCRFRLTPERAAAGRDWRRRWGFGDEDLVLISIANPRPQKRLELLPRALAAAQQALERSRRVRLVFCGEATPGKRDAEECVRRTQAEIRRLKLEDHVRWTGSVAGPAEVLAAADILVSMSAHEGLSLAQLEALALGCAVVATDVGGAREIAWDNPGFHLAPASAAPEEFGRLVAHVAKERLGPRNSFSLSDDWSSRSMAGQYARLYPRAIACARRQLAGDGLWLITNNLSTGGAQSSARRLLLGLAAEGESVRAAVIEENPDDPTPGRRQLEQAGIPVFAANPDQSPEEMARRLLAALDRDWPQAIVFWNLRPELKLLLAESLPDLPVFDVSPGEMYFQSLERCFRSRPAGRSQRTPLDYGSQLAGIIVKYPAEAERAGRLLGQPAWVVPNGVPLPRVAVVHPSAPSKIVFGTAARIHPQKRLEDLLAAFRIVHSSLPECVLTIAGGVEQGCESYAAELQRMAHHLPVEWLGEISDLAAFHHALSIFVMISEPAGCPNASLEALAAGLPVIATDFGGASEQVVDGVTGRLVPPRDPVALSEAMINLARRPDLWPVQGQTGRAHVQARFTMEQMISNYRRILLGRGGKPHPCGATAHPPLTTGPGGSMLRARS